MQRLTNEAATSSGSPRPPGLLAAIRAHQGVKALKKPEPVSLSKSENFEDSLRVKLAMRREAVGGQDLGSWSKLIPEPQPESGQEDYSAGFQGKSKTIVTSYFHLLFLQKRISWKRHMDGNFWIKQKFTPIFNNLNPGYPTGQS